MACIKPHIPTLDEMSWIIFDQFKTCSHVGVMEPCGRVSKGNGVRMCAEAQDIYRNARRVAGRIQRESWNR